MIIKSSDLFKEPLPAVEKVLDFVGLSTDFEVSRVGKTADL
jgi:hypothetical protein